MSILTREPPRSVNVCGKEYAVKTDFRVWLRFSAIVSDSKIDGETKAALLLALCFDDAVPENKAEALIALCGFFGGEEKGGKKNGFKTRRGGKSVRSFDFEIDAPYIYAAFLQAYGIDLTSVESLHWFLFLSLFKALPDECKLSKIIGWRTADLSKLSADSARQYARLKEFYALPDASTEEEKLAAIGETLAAGIVL